MHVLFAHKSLQITFLPCICLFRGRVFPSPPAHDDGTVRRHTTCSPLEGERGGRCEKLPVSVQLPPCFLPSRRHPARCPRRHRSRLRRRADASTKFCTQSANTPLVQLHTMTVHNGSGRRGDNGDFEGDNTPHFGSAVAWSERGLHNANTPLVQLHAMTAHNAKQNRIKGKEDNGG